MSSLDLILQLALLALLGVTMVHAIRLERALRTLRQDRAALGEVVAGFDTSTKLAEAGFGKLQAAASETAVLIAQKLEAGTPLRDDLEFLIQRGETVADRLDDLVRASRSLAPAASAPPAPAEPAAKMRSQSERDLLLALRGAR